MTKQVRYLHLKPGSDPPAIDFGKFKAVVALSQHVSSGWRAKISEWLVCSGCVYMMAWGQECSLWDDSVDLANLQEFPDSDIPDDCFVMTTWHSDEPLSEVFWFCKNVSSHPIVDTPYALLIDISSDGREQLFLEQYNERSG